jgi:hypothetical protein
MTEYALAGGATTAYEAAGSGPLSVPAPRPGGQVPGKVVPLMLAFSRSDTARA